MKDEFDAPMLIRGLEAGSFAWANASFRSRSGLDGAELAQRPFAEWLDPESRAEFDALIRTGCEGRFCARHQTGLGESLPLDVTVKPGCDGWTVCARLQSDDDVLDAYADEFDRGTVAGTLETIARIIENQNPGYRCSILLKNRGRFARGAGPSLPEAYNDAIDGEAIGPAVGSCGTAIYWNVPIIVDDIQNSPLWEPFAGLAEEAGVAACWSHPFTNSAGEVLGALALYGPRPEAPTPEQLKWLRAAARMTGLAVERGRVEEDLRDQRKREAELEEQLRQAAKMEAMGVLAGGVAHDFNNLLMTISGNAELAMLKRPAEEAVRDALERIVATSQRAAEFCRQMLTYAGREAISVGRIEFNALILEARDLAHVALSKKTNLVFSLRHEPIYVDADENRLLQVVLSLVTNAAEAIGDSTGQIEVTTDVVHRDRTSLARLAPDLDLPAGPYLRLIVADDGEGMDDEVKARMFDPFFTTKFTGRGLGLAAVTGIVRQHNGAIRVESEPGEGTTFEVLLPAVESEASAPAATDGPSAVPSTNGRVLVVDDEGGPRQVFRMALEGSGFSVVEAVDGEDALRVFDVESDQLDCVLLDVSMPKLGGHEVLREIRRQRDDVPVVLISGYSEENILDRLDGDPVAGVLKKPVPVAQLVDTIRSVIRNGHGAPPA